MAQQNNSRRTTKASENVSRLVGSKVNMGELREPGSHLNLHETLVLDLARAYQYREDPDYAVISWANQVKAENYFNEHGFAQTLTLMNELAAVGEPA